MKRCLDEPIDEVREWFESIDDDCPHLHHVKLCHDDSDVFVEAVKQGHPLPCATGTCQSKLRILRAASVHYANLRKLLHSITMARQCHRVVENLDSALHSADFSRLCKLLGIQYYTELIDEYGDIYLSEGTDKESRQILDDEGLPHCETKLQVTYASTIEEYQGKLKDDPEHACVSCHRLLCRSNVTKFKFDAEKFDSEAWQRLKKIILECDPDTKEKALYVCQYCRPKLNSSF